MAFVHVLMVFASVVFAIATGELLCSEELFNGLGGVLPSPRSPSEYSTCVEGAVHTASCPNGQIFDTHAKKCLLEPVAQETRMYSVFQFEELCSNPNVVEIFPNPTNCSQYIICYGLVPIEQTCGNGLLFNPQLNTCDIPTNVICGYSCPAVDDPYNPVWLPDARLEDCSRHYLCFQGNPLQFYCYNNLYFDIVSRTCTYPRYSACRVPGVYCNIDMTENVVNPRSCTSYYACVDGFPHFRNCAFGEYFAEELGVCMPGTCQPGTTTTLGTTTNEPTSTTVSSGTTPSLTSTTDSNTPTTDFTSPSFTTPELTSTQGSTTTIDSSTMSITTTTQTSPTTEETTSIEISTESSTLILSTTTTPFESTTTAESTTFPTVTESTTFVPSTPELTTSGEVTTPDIATTTQTSPTTEETTSIEISTESSTLILSTTTTPFESTTTAESTTIPTVTESTTFDPSTPELTTSGEITTPDITTTTSTSSTTLETTSELVTESTTPEISTQSSTPTEPSTSELTETTTAELTTTSTESTTTELATTSTTEMVTINPNELCLNLGSTALPYPNNCYMYILCINNIGGVMTCAADQIFNPITATCAPGNQQTCTLT